MGRRRATSCSTSTTASARWCRDTPTRRSCAPSASASRCGTHFAAPTEDAIVVAEELARRFGLPRWRFVNSGSEATMDAIRIARAHTGPGHGRQDLRLLPRPPRRRDGLHRRALREDRRPRRLRVAPLRRGHPDSGRRADRARPLQRRRRDEAPDRAPDRGRPAAGLRDHGGRDDEPRRRAPGARLPRGGTRADARARHRADLRRGQDGADDRGGRRDRALRRHPRSRLPRQGAGRRPPDGRDRRHRGVLRARSSPSASTRSAPTTATRWRWPRPEPASSRSSRPTRTLTSTPSTSGMLSRLREP